MNERQLALEKLKDYFLHDLVEDPIDGTGFDCDVLDAINALIDKYKEN